jgi:NAD(P)-dependent dehydrogenase (short-subunit alcohol dehydrogenase family)
MTQTLQDKVALITGGGQGIGLALAKLFSANGASVVITGRDGAKLERAALEIGGDRIAHFAGEVSSRADAGAAVALAIERFGTIDILVNNAQTSTGTGTPLEDVTDEMVEGVLHSGLLGTLYHMQAAFPHMKAAGGGTILNMGSREGIYGGHGTGMYAATKEGIRGLSRVAAREWGRHNIRVNVICPAALTAAAADFLALHPDLAEVYRKEIALGRFGDPDTDIAPVALFLASDAGRYLTGQTINADGGQIML